MRYLQAEENAVYFASLLDLIVSPLHSFFSSANPLILVNDRLVTAFGMPMNALGEPIGAVKGAVVGFFYGLKNLGFVDVGPDSELAGLVGG